MKNSKFLPIIGIEVHIELKTKSKMFCGCSANHFRVKPNIHTCPVCLGLPGALPVPNRQAIEWCLLIGMALNCKIVKESKFDRKNYFYPDLPKGYQISQYDQPFCVEGKLKLPPINNQRSIIRINRVHMEEDTGKLIHRKINGKECTLIDFNRSGVPLVEIVSRPDINSSQEAVAYLKKLQQIIRYLGVSDCDMEKGSMRCEINISLASQQIPNSKFQIPNYKVEVKNINSFRFIKRAIEYEIKRQREILLSGKTPIQETRGFDENTGETFSQRIKEEARDYRYFPEPDIPPIKFSSSEINQLKNLLLELPDEKQKRFVKDYGLSEYNAKILTSTRELADYFEKVIKIAKNFITSKQSPIDNKELLKKVVNVVVNKRVDINKYSPRQLVNYLLKEKASQLTNKAELEKLVNKVLKENKKAVEDYKKGKQAAIGFLMGQLMRLSSGKADPQFSRKILLEKLEK